MVQNQWGNEEDTTGNDRQMVQNQWGNKEDTTGNYHQRVQNQWGNEEEETTEHNEVNLQENNYAHKSEEQQP